MTPGTVAHRIATIVSVLYAGALYVGGVVVTDGVKQLIAYLPSVVTVRGVVFDKWAWKWWPSCLIADRPRVDGAWSSIPHAHSASHIPEGGNRGPIQAAVIIEQTFFSLHIVQYTAESRSHSTAATIRRHVDSRERAALAFVYANEPRQNQQPCSLAHRCCVEPRRIQVNRMPC
jgi:hypothetical protein